MFSGIIRHLPAAVTAVTVLTGTLFLAGGAANADSQDDKFLELLGENGVPAVDGADSLIATGHKVCSELDGGMSANDLVELIRNNGFNDNPLARLYPQRQVTATITRFINAAVQAYCPYDAGKITSIAAFHPSGSGGVTIEGPDRGDRSHVVVLASMVGMLPAGEIPPTKPLPVPAQPPPPPPPEELAPAPQQPPPPPPRHVQQAPQRQPQPASPPEEAPPQEAPPAAEPPQAPAPAAPAPAPAPGGDNGGAPAPESPPPAPPPPPGHIRLAP